MENLIWVMLAAVFFSLILKGRAAQLSPYLVAVSLIVSSFLFLGSLPVSTEQPQILNLAWSQNFGVDFVFRFDALATMMAVLITFIGSGVFLYAGSYMRSSKNLGRFYSILSIFTMAMVGLVCSDNMIVFFLFWETTSVCSFLLVGTKHETEKARESARKALFITVGGGLLLLVAFVMISHFGQQQGLDLSESLLFSNIDSNIVESTYFPWIVFLVAMAVATKSAQFPFHIWLPAAMAGPTPVSSFLHSATMVKAGVFLLARLTPFLGGNVVWNSTFATMGALTMLVGALLSASQRDIKKILAFSTIAVLGILVMLLGIGSDIAIKAAIVFLVAHAFYKAALFQIIGNIDFATGSRDIKTLGSLAKFLPLTAVAALLSSLSMAGAPPLFGFFGKELAYLAKLQLDGFGWFLILMAVLTNVLLVGLAISICYRPFWSKNKRPEALRSLPLTMSVVPFVFSLCGLLIGLFPAYFDQLVGTQAATVVAGKSLQMKLKLWHGLNLESILVLTLSVLTLGVGLVVALKIKPIIDFLSQRILRLEKIGPNRLYDHVVGLIPEKSASFMNFIQNGDVHSYMRRTLLGVGAVSLLPALFVLFDDGLNINFDAVAAILSILIVMPVVFSLFSKSKLVQLIYVGGSGFGIVLTFVVYGAPDLALTQLLVECLLLIFILLLLKKRSPLSQKSQAFSMSSVATAFLLSAVLTTLMAAGIGELPNQGQQYYLANSLAEAYGKNIVNVILVDFRSLDTFGEVVVVAIAALGCGSLLLRKKVPSE